MAIARTYPTTECDWCGDEFDHGVNADYCSQECLESARGERVLNLLKYDHRFCHGDFTKLKEVSRPTDEQLRQIQGIHSTESVIGFQYGTEHAETGEKTLRADTYDVVGTGIVCSNCGTTDHTDSFQRDFEPGKAAKRLRERIQETREEGQHDWAFDTESFLEAWQEHTGEWELCLGKALHKRGH